MVSPRRGFTLIELMVALAVLAMISVFTWQTLGSALSARDNLAFDDELEKAARTTLGRIRREVSLAFLTPSVQAVNSYRTVFVGKDDGETDKLWFATRSHRRTLAGARESDQTEITLWCDDDPDHRSRYVLLHREAQRIDHLPDKDGGIMPLARNVSRFDLRYLDHTNGEWQDEWDTQGAETPNRLPRAVQVVLTMLAEDPADEDVLVERSYLTTIVVETAPRLQQSATAGSNGNSFNPTGLGF
jgi:prepilin-type N-terminal cleavage/methylation domain-containing protein